jgi:hypothetical protein
VIDWTGAGLSGRAPAGEGPRVRESDEDLRLENKGVGKNEKKSMVGLANSAIKGGDR